MCRLVPLLLPDGRIIDVSEYKVEKLKMYLRIFPLLTSVDKVILFGSALETRCREDSDIDFLFYYNDKKKFRYDMNYTLPDAFPDSCYDDKLRMQTGTVSSLGALRSAQQKGVILYERGREAAGICD